jgi:hypothetical protein
VFVYLEFSCARATATSFPLSKHTGGGDTAPAFLGLRVYLQFIGKWVFAPLLWSFPPTIAFTSFPAPDCWVCAAAPAGWHVCLQLMWEMGAPPSPVEFSSLCHSHKLSRFWLLGTHRRSRPLHPGPAFLFTILGGIPLPFSSVLRVPHPLCYVSLLFLLIIIQFLSFPRVGAGLSGGYADLAQDCLWEYCVPLSSPCGPCLSKQSGRWHLVVAQEPSWFLHSMSSGDALHRLEVWRGQSFASSQWPCLKGVSPASLQDFTLGDTLSASSF